MDPGACLKINILLDSCMQKSAIEQRTRKSQRLCYFGNRVGWRRLCPNGKIFVDNAFVDKVFNWNCFPDMLAL